MKTITPKSWLYTMHEMIHTEKPYQCNQCGEILGWKSLHNYHEMIHNEEKPYKCSQHHKSFVWKSQLTMHKMVHNGEKPY
jgi:KRAB domain-containing zinc finger protein